MPGSSVVFPLTLTSPLNAMTPFGLWIVPVQLFGLEKDGVEGSVRPAYGSAMLDVWVYTWPVTKILPPETPPAVRTLAAWTVPPPLVLMLLLLGESASTSQLLATTDVLPLKVTSTLEGSGDRPRMQVGPIVVLFRSATARPLTLGAVIPGKTLAR